MIVFLVPPGEEEVVTMDELTGAKILRGLLKGSAEEKIHILVENLVKFHNVDTGQVTMEQITELQARLDDVKEVLETYTEAFDRCQTLEFGEYNPDDEHLVEREDMEDDLFELNYKIQALKARVKEEKSARARAEASAQRRQDEEPVVKPLLMEKGITLDEMETWSSTWEDYYQVAKLEKEVPAIQRPNFKSHLSQEICDVVEHVLGIGPDSTKKLDDRLLTEIMAGLPDQETREELLARVETPKMEEANGAMRRHEDPAWTWMVKLFSRSVVVTVFDRGKSPWEDTGRSPREDFDMTKHDMTNCCLVGWREG